MLIFITKWKKMELVPIIYNSLILVFTLLALVVGGSLICSKLLFCGHNEDKKGTTKQNDDRLNKAPLKVKSVHRELAKKTEKKDRRSHPIIKRKLIDKKKVKVVRAVSRKKENAFRVASNNASRYSVLNTNNQDQRPNVDLFSKFSKMSIKYSQSA